MRQLNQPEQLTILPERKRPPLTRNAGRIGGTDGQPQNICLDSGANVERLLEENGLTGQVKRGRPTFSTADGKTASGVGWVDTKIGLRTRLQVTTRFVVAKDLDYWQMLLGVNALKPLNEVIDFHMDHFRFRLPEGSQWRSLPLGQDESGEKVSLAFATTSQKLIPEYVQRLLEGLLDQPTPIPEVSTAATIDSDHDPSGSRAPLDAPVSDGISGMPALISLGPNNFDNEFKPCSTRGKRDKPLRHDDVSRAALPADHKPASQS